MSEIKDSAIAGEQSGILEFLPDLPVTVSSFAGSLRAKTDEKPTAAEEVIGKVKDEVADAATVERSPAFRELSEPKLPRLEHDNRARLLMQTPNRLFFYWSTRTDPFRTLGRVVEGDPGNYALTLSLKDLKRGTEKMMPIDREGSGWFDVEADGEYRADIGFYSPSRPYVRVLFSNVVETPRKSPSPHTSDEAEWRLSSDGFAKVLDVAGFKQDAFDVALAGDDWAASDALTRNAFAGMIGSNASEFDDVSAEEIRYAMLALAAGIKLEELKFRTGALLYSRLQANAEKVSSKRALAAVQEHFGVEPGEIIEEETLSAVYGTSLVNFPRTLKRRFPQKLEPVSS